MESDSTWTDDVLQRQHYANFLTKVLIEKKGPYVLNLNAHWGEGKTFFIKKWRNDLKYKHPTIYFNAWENDFSNDPIVALISCIAEEVKNQPGIAATKKLKADIKDIVINGGKLAKAATPAIIKGLISTYIGVEMPELVDKLSEEGNKSIGDIAEKMTNKYIELHGETKRSIDLFKGKITALLNDITSGAKLSLPLFFFIDELDRCRPLYSIELLEKIKHVFDIEGVIFIVATDTKQLSHSVRAVYGQDFDAEVYLKRFFDREYTLPEPDYEQFALLLIRQYRYDEKEFNLYFLGHHPHRAAIQKCFSALSIFFQLSLRDQEQCFAKLDAIRVQTKDRLHIFYLLFLIILHMKEADVFEEFFTTKYGNANSAILTRYARKDLEVKAFSFNKTYALMELVGIYHDKLSLTRDDLRREINRMDNNLDSNLYAEIFQDFASLQKYRELVRLVGALS